MKCNMPKHKPLSSKDYRKIVDAITNVRCCKCGETVEVMSMAYATINFDKKRYENRLCDKCKKEQGEEV